MNKNVRSLISWWTVIGRDQHDPFMKFFTFYMCLDAWMTAESGMDRDSDKLDWLINTDNELKRHWGGIKDGAMFQSWLNGLAGESPIPDSRPSQQGKRSVALTSTSDFEQVIRFINQVRNNFFHGNKSPVNPTDRKLVRWSGSILEKWIEWTLAKTN